MKILFNSPTQSYKYLPIGTQIQEEKAPQVSVCVFVCVCV